MYPEDLARGGGGGGGVLPYVCILGMCRARDPHFQPWIQSVPEYIIFTNYQKSVPEHHHFRFFGGFCSSGDHHFQNFFNFNPFIASHGRLSPNAKCSAAPRRPGISGESHFHAQNGSSSCRSPALSSSKWKRKSSSFRCPAFSRSTGSSFRSPGPFFTLNCRGTYLPKFFFFGEYTPPPPAGRTLYKVDLYVWLIMGCKHSAQKTFSLIRTIEEMRS